MDLIGGRVVGWEREGFKGFCFFEMMELERERERERL